MDQFRFLAAALFAGNGEQQGARMRRKHLFAISIVVGVGFVLRLIAISGRGIWYDDAFSIFLARLNLAAIVAGTAADTMPPLYYFLLHFWLAAGESIAWLRMMNVMFSLAVILLVYIWVWKMFGDRAAFWAALLTAVSPIQIYHAQEIRMYALLELTQLGYILFFFNSLVQESSAPKTRWSGLGNWIGLVICGTTALYTHNLAIFVIVVPNIILLLRRRWPLSLKLLVAQAAMMILAVPWLVMIPGQIEKIQRAFWTPQPGVVEILQAIVVLTAALPLHGIWQTLAIILSVEAFVLTALVVGKTLFLGILPNGSENDSRARNQLLEMVVMIALVPPLLMFIASYVMRPLFVPRGFLLSSLAYFALIGWLAGSRFYRVGGRLVIGAVLLAAIVSLPFQYTYDQFPRSPFEEAAVWLEGSVPPGSRVIHDNKLSFFPTRFYAQGLEQVFLGDKPGSHNDTFAVATQTAMGIYPENNLLTAAQEIEQVYFVIFDKAIQEYQAAGLPNHPSLEWLDSCYELVDQVAFEDLSIFHYTWLGTCQID
jgi:mannosyltransferase